MFYGVCVKVTFSDLSSHPLSELVAIEQGSHSFPLASTVLQAYSLDYPSWGIFSGHRLLAFVFYQTVLDEGEIIHLVCDSKYQGKGIAKQLMQQLIDQHRQQGIQQWHLEVRESNLPAIKLYQRLGFLTVGRRKQYYRNGEDALLMQLVCAEKYLPNKTAATQ